MYLPQPIFYLMEIIMNYQLEGIAMGSPLSPVVADLFTENFEPKALLKAQNKPSWFFDSL